MRAARAHLRVLNVDEHAFIRRVLRISIHNFHGYVLTPALVQRAAGACGVFYKRRYTNASPQAVVGALGFLQMWQTSA